MIFNNRNILGIIALLISSISLYAGRPFEQELYETIIKHENIKEINDFITKNPNAVQEFPARTDITPLAYAISMGAYRSALFLIERGAPATNAQEKLVYDKAKLLIGH